MGKNRHELWRKSMLPRCCDRRLLKTRKCSSWKKFGKHWKYVWKRKNRRKRTRKLCDNFKPESWRRNGEDEKLWKNYKKNKERRKLDKQLDVVQEKTKRAYLSQEILEAKMKLQEHERIVELDKEASRTNTLNPSASFYVRANSGSGEGGGRREGGRPSYMPMRSASMRETSYSRSIRRSRMRPPTHNDSTLSVADTTGSSIITTSPNIAIEEVNSNGSN